MKVKVNRKHFIDPFNIKTLEKKNNIVYIYLKSGYPPILKTDCDINVFLLRLVNVNLSSSEIDKIVSKVK